MPRITRSEVIDFTDASEADRARALASAAELAEAVFEGPGLATFCVALRNGAFPFYQMALYYHQDELVGLAGYTLDPIEGEPRSKVIRALAILRPAFREGRLTAPFWVRAGIQLLWRHRGVTLWNFTPAQHVASYRFLAKHLRGMVPHPERAPTEEEVERVRRLARQFNYGGQPTDHPLSCRRTIWARGTQRAHVRTSRPRDAFDETFEALNPAVNQGGCLLTLGRIHLGAVLFTLLLMPVHLLRDGLRARLSALSRAWGARLARQR